MGSRHDLLDTAWTAAWLSHQHQTRAPCHRLPHIAQAMRIAHTSLNTMWWCRAVSGHSNWCWLHAPHPQWPNASEVMSMVLAAATGRTAVPFHPVANIRHHWRSARNCRFKHMWWCWRWGTRKRSIIRRRKDRPGLTTLQACWRVPIRESSSLPRRTFNGVSRCFAMLCA